MWEVNASRKAIYTAIKKKKFCLFVPSLLNLKDVLCAEYSLEAGS